MIPSPNIVMRVAGPYSYSRVHVRTSMEQYILSQHFRQLQNGWDRVGALVKNIAVVAHKPKLAKFPPTRRHAHELNEWSSSNNTSITENNRC